MNYENVIEAVNFIKSKINIVPDVAFIFGSGLGKMDNIVILHTINYKEIPNFPITTAPGHKGELVFGTIGGKYFVAQRGRFHYYEGYSANEIIFGVRVMYMLGAKYLFVSNAAGGVNYDYNVGDLMIIDDHINLLPNPLIGKNDERFGTRFPDMTHCYNKKCIEFALEAANEFNFHIHQGIYLASSGPTFETKAEYNYFRTIGADAVGMSTTPEVIAARHLSMKVFGISIITNTAFSFADDYENDADEVIKIANIASERLYKIFEKVVERI